MKSSLLLVLCSLLHCISADTLESVDEFFLDLLDMVQTMNLKDDEVWKADANAVSTCQLQQPAVSFTITNVDAEVTGCDACAHYRACLTLNLPLGKASIAQSCVKEPNSCNPPDFEQYNGRSFKSSNAGVATGVSDTPAQNGGTQCQIGSAGETLEFMLKDGPSCQPPDGQPDYAEVTGVTTLDNNGDQSAVGISCRSQLGWNGILPTPIGSCNTSSSPVSECVWRVKLPDCAPRRSPSPVKSPSHSPRPSAARSPSPRRSPVRQITFVPLNQITTLNHVPVDRSVFAGEGDDSLSAIPSRSINVAPREMTVPLWATAMACLSLILASVAAPVLLKRWRLSKLSPSDGVPPVVEMSTADSRRDSLCSTSPLRNPVAPFRPEWGASGAN